MVRGNTLLELQGRLTAALDAKAGQLASGAISPAQFVVEAEELLSFAHSRAAVLGSFRAKRHNPPTNVAIRVAAQASAEQRDFLLRFVRDLAAGRYNRKGVTWGDNKPTQGARQRKARFALYAKRLGGTANRSFAETLIATDANVEALWTLGRRDKHCPDCRVQASYGWRPLRSLLFLPGEGRTRCMVKCGCKISTRQGVESYTL